jgi:hypothetical protein
MTKARNLADNALTTVSPTELGYVDGVTSPIQTQLDARITNALVDAKGDLLTATADNVPARLGVGANDTVLTADSAAATGLKWATPAAGGMTSLATGTLSGTTTTLSSISGSYKHLYLVITGAQSSTASNPVFIVNGSTGANYQSKYGATDTITWQTYSTFGFFRASGDSIPITANNNMLVLEIENYSITGYKPFRSRFQTSVGGTIAFGSNLSVTAPITSIGISTFDGTYTLSVGTYTLYGVK